MRPLFSNQIACMQRRDVGCAARTNTVVVLLREQRCAERTLQSWHGRLAGFTLLEMVLVLFLVGLMASAAMMLTEGVEDQTKYDETKRRMELIRKAIVGDPTRTVNGGPEISGFVADMGRLPGCLRELLEANDCAEPANPLTPWSIDANTGIASGWRGPYLQTLPERDGALRFRDGYGNSDADDTLNSGWNWQVYDAADNPIALADFYASPEDGVGLRVQSVGLKMNDDGDNYPVGALNSLPALINEFDHRVPFNGWNNVVIRFKNNADVLIDIPQNSLRLMLASTNSSIESASFPDRKISIPPASGVLPAVDSDTAIVPDGSIFNAAQWTMMIGNDGYVDLSLSSNSYSVPVRAGELLTVPQNTTYDAGAKTLTLKAGDIAFPAEGTGIVLSGLTIPNLSTLGGYSLLLVCNDLVNVNSVDGQRFDGDCARYGTDAAPTSYEPLNQPYLFTAVPRSIPVTPPQLLVWHIR